MQFFNKDDNRSTETGIRSHYAGKAFWVAFLSFCCVFFIGHFALWKMFEVKTDSSSFPRNPNYFGGWVEWTDGIKNSKSDKDVVVIANSQGYFKESCEGELCYPALLENYLNEGSELTWNVHNWSRGGIASQEVVILATKAAISHPDYIIFSLFPNNFPVSYYNTPIEKCSGDLQLIAAEPSVLRHLPDAFRKHYRLPVLKHFPQRYTGYGKLRWRSVLEDPFDTWSWKSICGAPKNIRFAYIRKKYGKIKQLGKRSSWSLKQVITAVTENSPETKILFLSMPTNELALNERSIIRAREFAQYLREELSSFERVEVLDAHDLIEPDLYYTHTHFNEEGHAKYAHYLFDNILNP